MSLYFCSHTTLLNGSLLKYITLSTIDCILSDLSIANIFLNYLVFLATSRNNVRINEVIEYILFYSNLSLRHKQYHTQNTFLSPLTNATLLSHKTTTSPQVHTPQRSPDSTTDTNVSYVSYPTTYLQVPIPMEQTAESLSSSHSSQQSNSSPHTLAYALPAQFQNPFSSYHSG